MARHFVFPQNLRALEEEHDDNRLSALNPTDVTSLRPSELEEFVKGVSFDLSDKELFCIEEQEVFDRVYSLVRGFSTLAPSCKAILVESLRSNLSVLLANVDSLSRVSHTQDDEPPVMERMASYRNAFKVYTLFLLNIVSSEESDSGSNGSTKVTATARKKKPMYSWNWELQKGRILNMIAVSLEINLTLLFGSVDPDENYLSFIVKNVFSLFENAPLLRDSDTKDALCRVIGVCAAKYHYTAQLCASIIHLIHKYDFVATHMADAVAAAEKKYADGTLASSIIREVGRTNPKAYVKDTAGAENIGRFLVELADRLPKMMSTNIGLLVPHFCGESYKIRNALVGVMGKLVAKAFNDIETELSSKSIRLRTKQAMLEILLERCRDVSAYTRSRVLQVWAELCEEHSIPIGLWNEVASIAAGRLEDKSAVVRKSSLSLLIMMLQHNPFGPQLRILSFEATLEQYKKKLNELEPENASESVLDGLSSDKDSCHSDSEVDNQNAELNEHLESLPDSFAETDRHVKSPSSVPDVGSLEQTRALIASLEAGLMFSKCISSTMATLIQLMASSTATDVENTILLLMRCRQFQIDGAGACLQKMLPLVFSQDKSIYEAVENAFLTIYVRKSPIETAKNLLNLAIESNIGDQAALEFIVDALGSKGDITSNAISSLWDFFCFNVNGTTAEQSRGALSVLCMAAKSSGGILGLHLQDIVDIGFGRWAKIEPLLARTACVAIQRMSEEERKKLLLTNGSQIFGILESLITGFGLPDNIWYAATDKAIDVIYMIHPTPEIFAANLVKKSLSSVFDGTGGDTLQDDISNCTVSNLTTVQVSKLSRYLFITSHIALKHLVYIESCVKNIQKGKAFKSKMDANVTETVDEPKENGINAELGLSGSEDALIETLSERAEKEIVSGLSGDKNLIGESAPFLSKLCRNFSLLHKLFLLAPNYDARTEVQPRNVKQKLSAYPKLQASAMLALCRFMIIDGNYCDANLQLLFTVVENAPSEIVRSNCTIALADLVVRFPNLLEPWTENMYARLRDPSNSVRKNAVLVLSHLILNDMMKVKGYINEMAMRVEDDNDRIANLAKLFFHELSKKGSNPIYNLLPDILGRLSNQDLGRESFCNIMQFLIGSIKKEKQMEGLVEKLCNRFSGVTDIIQWENLSYCLSQLTYTEKGMKKLIESFKTYEHALSEHSVLENFRNIANKAKKFAKPEIKVCIEEFEEKLNKLHLEKKEQDVTARNAEIHRLKVSNLEGMLSKGGREENTESDECEDGEVSHGTVGGMRKSRNNDSKTKLTESEESSAASSEVTDPEGGDAEVQSPQVCIRGASKSQAQKAVVKDRNGDVPTGNRRNVGTRRR